jgi:hypothetical protein
MSDKKTTPEQPDRQPRLGPDGKPLPEEIGGPKGLEPTRYGDWDVNGRVSDF